MVETKKTQKRKEHKSMAGTREFYRLYKVNSEVVYREIEYSNNYGFQKAMEIILQ